MVIADIVMMPVALWSALALKEGTLVPSGPQPVVWVAAVLFISVVVFARLGLYRSVIRFIAPKAVSAIAIGVTICTIGLMLVDRLDGKPDAPISAWIIFWPLAFLYVAGTRFLARSFFLRDRGKRGTTRVAIYGAGGAGAQLASSLRVSDEFLPLCFIDDNESLHGSYISGLEVFGIESLGTLVSAYGIQRVLLAVPSVSTRRRREILQALEPAGVRVQTVPDYASILNGVARVDKIRDVEPSDLLGRDPVPPRKDLLAACVTGKSVMVTGAGGSIGSELCRQIIRESPTRLLLLEMSEHSLYQIHRELQSIAATEKVSTEIIALLGNAHHKQRVREILQSYGVQTIYHAAAYKHVPIVERNMIEGVHNNVLSTWHAAEAAMEHGAETFVLVSTDKAVNPTNVMGATKRLAEIVLQGLQQRGGNTRFSMVRFGNVLESSGSVVPLFREQIRHGGPVTVTHPEVTRYFMTIPEAAQLVIQASAMAEGGDVFVLDMGRSIRIADLARRMIQLSGNTVKDDENPNGDIEIRYTGLRPAEKLYEELLIGNSVTGTQHPMILRAVEHAPPWPEVAAILDRLSASLRRFDCKAVLDTLCEAVREYEPDAGIQDAVWARLPERSPPVPASIEAKVTDLSLRRARQPNAAPPP